MDNSNNVYYITILDGHCEFKEVIPSMNNDSEHNTVYEIKSDNIYAFNVSEDGQIFHFMDQYRIINKLERMKDSRSLHETAEFYIKDKDRPQFAPSGYYDSIVLND